MADETTRIDKPNGRISKEHVNWGAIVLALLTGLGGMKSSMSVSDQLSQVAVTLAEIKGSVQRQDDGRLRLEARMDRMEERVRSLEMRKNQ